MTSTTVSKQSRIEQARERLERAVSEIEAAVESRAEGGDAANAETARALEAARADNAALRERTETASKRLDDAIHRLRAVLEG